MKSVAQIIRSNLLIITSIFVAFTVFLSEPWIVDLFRSGHFTWVSFSSLAIVRHSLSNFGGVGYSCSLTPGDGNIQFENFNRYPIPFAVLTRWILIPFEGDWPTYLYASRQWMNIIFLATLWTIYLILREIGTSRSIAIFAVLGTALDSTTLFYKSMFHFDQPALLLYSLLILTALKTFGSNSFSKWKYLTVLGIGSLTGRSAIVLCYGFSLALILSIKSLIKSRLFLSNEKVRLAWSGFIMAIILVGIATSYNIVWEALITGVAPQKTEIFISALRRLDFHQEGFSPSQLSKTLWTERAPEIIMRHVGFYASKVLDISLVLTFLLFLLTVIKRKRLLPLIGYLKAVIDKNPARVLAWQSIFLSSIIWIVAMKNLLVFHEYAAMVMIPFFCLVLSAVAESLSLLVSNLFPSIASGFLTVALILVIASFLWQVVNVPASKLNPSMARRAKLDQFFTELKAFNLNTSSKQTVLRNTNWLPGSPSAQCLMLNQPLLIGEPTSQNNVIQAPSLLLK